MRASSNGAHQRQQKPWNQGPNSCRHDRRSCEIKSGKPKAKHGFGDGRVNTAQRPDYPKENLSTCRQIHHGTMISLLVLKTALVFFCVCPCEGEDSSRMLERRRASTQLHTAGISHGSTKGEALHLKVLPEKLAIIATKYHGSPCKTEQNYATLVSTIKHPTDGRFGSPLSKHSFFYGSREKHGTYTVLWGGCRGQCIKYV